MCVDSPERIMADEELFGELPEQVKPRAGAEPRGAPRLREPMREQIELRAVDIESLIGQEHPARVIWAYVEGLDLSEHEAALSKAGLVDLEKLTQDGVRIRANAGTGSFRREATLDRQMAQAQAI